MLFNVSYIKDTKSKRDMQEFFFSIVDNEDKIEKEKTKIINKVGPAVFKIYPINEHYVRGFTL